VPDAGSSDQQQPTLSPQQQISLTMVGDRLGSLFGAGGDTPAGGGGSGGQYMFANIQELDAVIAQWKDVYQAILADGDTIDAAASFVEEPAHDGMSVGQADATRLSMVTLKKHNLDMQSYAEEYIKKLVASRDSMANTDQGNAAQLGSIDRS